jgi:hypothetical protein
MSPITQLLIPLRTRNACARDKHRRFRPWCCMLMLGATALSCHGMEVPQPFEWHYNFTDDDMIKSSSVIIVGRVAALRPLGEPVSATDDHGYHSDWQLIAVSLAVENQLRGSVQGSSVEFYFYTSLGPKSGDWNSLHVDDRCVFFLTNHGGSLRAVRDFWRSNIEIGSGQHSSLPATPRSTIEEQIATLLLTPGDRMDEVSFRRILNRAVPLAESWIGHCRTILLLKKLFNYPSLAIQNAARAQLRILPGSDVGCSQDRADLQQ